MKVKCGRDEIEVNENDLVMFNGACYQIVTKPVRSGWHEYPPKISVKRAEQMIKDKQLVFHHRDVRNGSDLHYYSFTV